MAVIEKEIDGVKKKVVIDNRTVYATPSWIPQVETHGEKGILVIDDMNRADGRIINSIMQLLQDAALLGWTLPEGWEIYCTCNPDDGHYDVTAFDGAQMTRMANFTQEFEKRSWLENWAIPTGIHPIAQNFVMTYPEMVVQGERTNPRSFDKFFRMIGPTLDKVKKADGKIELSASGEGGRLAKKINDYGLMNIELTPLQSFISFLTSGYGKLPGVEEILAKEFDIKKFYSDITESGRVRVDILASLNTRLAIYVKNNSDSIMESEDQMAGVKRWLKCKDLPVDLRYAVAEDIVDCIADAADAELAELIFGRLKVR